VILKAPTEDALELDLWPDPGPDFELMRRLKETFDPGCLLNRGRLYGRI
jgi:FAD/FMN-containing dehydrogenase